MNEALRRELLALAEQDQSFLGSPRRDWDSDEVQRQLLELMGRLRQRLVEILDAYGWPGKSLVGEDGAEAAWTLALHTMPEPDVLRRCLALLRDAAAAGEAEPWQVAFLVDRVSLVERNVQMYGTTICRQEDGSFGPPLLEDPDQVDERRRAVGLPPWNKTFARSRLSIAVSTNSALAISRCGVTSGPVVIRLARAGIEPGSAGTVCARR